MPPYTFTLLDDAGGRFAINGDALEVVGAIEGESVYPVTVQAVDQAAPERVLTRVFSITAPLAPPDYATFKDFKLADYWWSDYWADTHVLALRFRVPEYHA